MKSKHVFILNFLLISLISSIECDLNKNRTYINIENPIPCIRRFNSTNQIGCGKLNQGSYEGIVYAVRDHTEYNRLTKISNLAGYKLVVVTIPKFFSLVVEYYKQQDKKNNKINGIVLILNESTYKNTTLEQSVQFNYSDDTSSPNNKFSLYQNLSHGANDWNLAGRGFMFENFEIPFYVIYDENEAKLPFNDCFEKHNRIIFERYDKNMNDFKINTNDLLCGMELGLSMSGAVSSTVCTRRNTIMHTLESNTFCDPLGGSNYFNFLSQKPANDLPIVILSARLDTFTMYEYYTPGANEPISSLIGLFGIVELLNKYRDNLTKKNLLIVLFDNEAFDYGGSSRFASDLVNDEFPSLKLYNDESFQLKKENMTTWIELNQLGSVSLSDDNLLYIHKDPLSYGSNPNVAKIINDLNTRLNKYSNGSIQPLKNINQQLPPSSIHSFLRHNIQLGSVSITDHENEFKNNFYHSVFDTAENLNITFPLNITENEAINYTTKFSTRIQKLTTSIAQTIYSLSSENQTDLNEQVDQFTINKLVYCFYKNSTCDFFRSILTESQWNTYLRLLDANLPKGKLSFYTGVNDNFISGKWISHMLFRYFSRNLVVENLNSSDCNKDSELIKKFQSDNKITLKHFNFVNNSICVASSVYSVSGASPAFKNFDDGQLLKTDMYSAWTESSWNGVTIQMKMFMFTATNVSALTLSLGLIVSILAGFLTFFINKYSNKIFSMKNHEQEAIESFQ